MKTESTSLTGLPQKKITTGLKMLDAQPAELQRIVAAWPGAPEPIRRGTGIVYDAAAMSRILGLPCECDDPVPEASNGEIVIYYSGWDLPALRNCTAGQKRMWQDQNWYDDKGWKAEPGYYRLNLGVPNSNWKNWNKQVAHLRAIDEALQTAPVTVAASALLVHLTEMGNNLLKKDCCRCSEPLPGDVRAALAVSDGHVYVYYEGDRLRFGNLWLASARLVAPRKS